MAKFKNKRSETNPKSERIGRLHEDTFAYYRRLSDTLIEKSDDDEARDIFIQNAFTQLITEAIPVSQNQTISRIIEELLYVAKPCHILALLEVFMKDLETVCTDRFASYVMQTAVLLSSQHFTDEECGETLSEIFELVYRFFDSQLPVYMQDTYASHIVRVIIEILGGVQVDQRIVRSRVSQPNDKGNKSKKEVTLPTPNKQRLGWLTDLGHKIVGLGKLKDYAKNYLSNPVLQTLLLVLHQRDDHGTLDSMLRALSINMEMFDIDPETGLPELACHTIGSRLIEQVLVLATSDFQEHIYQRYIQGTATKWAIDGMANYAMQRLLEKGHSEEIFGSLFDELIENLEDVFAVNHLGVVVALAEGILKHNTRQKPFITGLQKAFHCHEPEGRHMKLVPLLASLTTYDVFYKVPDEKEGESSDSDDDNDDMELEMPTLKTIEYHGSLLLQKLLQMPGVQTTIAGGVLALNPTEIVTMATHPCGSHIVEALLKSTVVSPKMKEHLCKKLKGSFVSLACDRSGSRALDAVWDWASIKIRKDIAQELLQGDKQLKHNSFGKFIRIKCALDVLQRRQAEWEERQKQDIKKRKLFDELLVEGEKPKKKKKFDRSAVNTIEGSKETQSDDHEMVSSPIREKDGNVLNPGKKEKKKKSKEEDAISSETVKKDKKKKDKSKRISSEETQMTELKKKSKKKKKNKE